MRVGTVDPHGTVVLLLKPPFCANLVQVQVQGQVLAKYCSLVPVQPAQFPRRWLLEEQIHQVFSIGTVEHPSL